MKPNCMSSICIRCLILCSKWRKKLKGPPTILSRFTWKMPVKIVCVCVCARVHVCVCVCVCDCRLIISNISVGNSLKCVLCRNVDGVTFPQFLKMLARFRPSKVNSETKQLNSRLEKLRCTLFVMLDQLMFKLAALIPLRN